MKAILNKLKKALHELEKKHGPIFVFILFLREQSAGGWDLVVAAPWLSTNDMNSYKIVASKVQKLLNTKEIVQMSRVVIIDVDDPVVAFLQGLYNVPNGQFKEIENCEPFSRRFNFKIEQAYLLRCIKG